MKYNKPDSDGKIREAHSSFQGIQSWMNKIWLPAWTPEELRQIAYDMEVNDSHWIPPLDSRKEEKKGVNRGDCWKLTPEQQDLDEQMNGDDDRPY